MKTKLFTLLGAALVMVSGAVLAATDDDTARSAGAYPVAYDDYPESDVVVSVTDDIVLTVTGEARVRFEWVENTSDFSDHGQLDDHNDDDLFDDSYDFAPARMNLGFRVDLPRDVAAVIELQGGWDFGGNDGLATHNRAAVNQSLRPGSLNEHPFSPVNVSKPGATDDFPVDDARGAREDSSDTVHIYQGYLEMANIGDSIFSMRFGRQELAYGTEWLLGNQDFYDGLSWDGAKGIFQFNDCSRLDIFWAKVAEFNLGSDDGEGSGISDDEDLYGAYLALSSLGGTRIGLDAYIIGLADSFDSEIAFTTTPHNAVSVVTASPGTNDPTDDGNLGSFLEAWWLGLRVYRDVPTGLHFSAEVTYLTGDFNTDLRRPIAAAPFFEIVDSMDIEAWGFEGYLGWTWNVPSHPTFKAGLTYASGQSADDIDSAEWNTFFTPAGEIHPRLGMADMIEASNVVAWTLGYAGSANNHSWGVDFWHFEQDDVDPFLDADLGTSPNQLRFDEELGNEVDVWYHYQYSKNMVAQFALAYFDAGNFIEERNNCIDDSGASFWDIGAADDCNLDLVFVDTDGPGPNSPRDTSDALRFYANLLVRF